MLEVRCIVRNPLGQEHPKLRELPHADFLDFAPVEDAFQDVDACFYCLGVSAAGLDEASYRRITFDATLAAAQVQARLRPGSAFVYISGAGADASERGRSMWARVKGTTENALSRLPLQVSIFRPAAIQPLHGIRSRTRLYRVFYALAGPLLPLLRRAFPGAITTTDELARAMLRVAREGSPKPVLEASDIPALGRLSVEG